MTRNLYALSAIAAVALAGCPKSVEKPVASAGSALSVNAGSIVRLDGSASSDPQQRALTFSWSFASIPAGTKAAFNDKSTQTPSFTADVPGDYTVQLVVSNGLVASDPATVTVTAKTCGANAPVIGTMAAAPSQPGVGTLISLSAPITDADNDAGCGLKQTFSYQWTLISMPAGSKAALNDPHLAAPSFTTDAEGDYQVRLVVTDSTGLASVPQDLKVTAGSCGANAPEVQEIAPSSASPGIGLPVQLTAKIVDADNAAPCNLSQGERLAWSLYSLPPGSRASLNSATALSPSFTPDVAGEYLVRLIVTDSTGRSSAPKDLSVTATSCGGNAPTIGSVSTTPASPGIGTLTQLEAQVDDLDNHSPCSAGQALSYHWSLVAVPAGSAARLSSATVEKPTFTPDIDGSYVVRLVISDSTGLSSKATDTTISVSACGGARPVISSASAAPVAPNAGQQVTLTALATSADNGGSCNLAKTFTYQWTVFSRPPQSAAILSNPSQAAPTFTPDVIGGYEFQVVATDSAGLTSVPARVAFTTSFCGTATPTVTASASSANPNPGQQVTLTAVGDDADNNPPCSLGQTLVYGWSIAGRPNASTAVLSDPSAAAPTFVPDVAGIYQFRVQVHDSTGRISAPAYVTLTTTSCGAAYPTASIGLPSTAPLIGTTVTLAAQAGYPDNNPPQCSHTGTFRYAWRMTSRPQGSQAFLSDPSAASPTVVPDVAGSYQFQLDVWDSLGHQAFPTYATLNTAACGGLAPVARIGMLQPYPVAPAPAITSALPTNMTAQLDGSGSIDPNAACGFARPITDYRWQFAALPAGANAGFNNWSIVNPSFSPNADGTYVVLLSVFNGVQWSAPATATLNASAAHMIVDRGAGPYTALALDPSGNPVVAYLDNNSQQVKVARCTANCFGGGQPNWIYLPVVDNVGGTVGNPPYQGNDTARPVDIKILPNGLIFVAYHSMANCSAKVASFTGTAWNLATVQTGTGCNRNGATGGQTDAGRWLSLAIRNGAPALAYTFEDNGMIQQSMIDRYSACTSNCGGAAPVWSAASDVQAPANGVRTGRWPSLKVDGSGGVHLASFDNGNVLGYAECTGACTPGTTTPWARAVVDNGANNNNDVGRFASLDLTAAGAPRIAYMEIVGGGGIRRLRYANCNGACTTAASWSSQVADNNGDVGTHISLALDSTGAPRISYRSESQTSLMLAYSNGVGPFTAVTLDNSGSVGMFSSLALSPQNGVRVSYWDDGNQNVKFFWYGP